MLAEGPSNFAQSTGVLSLHRSNELIVILINKKAEYLGLQELYNAVLFWYNNTVAAGWSSPVARRAHNPKVIGSNPIPAPTYENSRLYQAAVFVISTTSRSLLTTEMLGVDWFIKSTP